MSRGSETDIGIMHGLLTKYYNKRLITELEEDADELAIGISPAELTAMLLWDVDNATLERVTVGSADSGGVGFKVLRIPN